VFAAHATPPQLLLAAYVVAELYGVDGFAGSSMLPDVSKIIITLG
jgi:hypothetical protein